MDLETLALLTYRTNNPRSRAEGITKLYGSTGVVRKRTCIVCGAQCRSSAKWPETKRSYDFAFEHEKSCAVDYIKRHSKCVGLEGVLNEAL